VNYIVFDFEFNQDFSSLQDPDRINWQAQPQEETIEDGHENTNPSNKKGLFQYPYEIIQIGAVKLDSGLSCVETFNRYIKPSIYLNISPFVTELTGITNEQLIKEESFEQVYEAFLHFIGASDSTFCTWGMSDIKALYKNAEYHKLNTGPIPRMYINLQPYVSTHLKLSSKKLLRLQTSVELLGIPITYEFHNAFYDAFYTAEIFKKINNPALLPKVYNPSKSVIRPRQPKQIIQYDKLIKQFEKMYSRDMTEEEQELIRLAYKMGRTRQFVE
jgi:inhibitor of KinA sporulation pathway (predicted exonuclease)